MTTDQALDSRARRAARRVGYIARKTRWRAGTIDNEGGFILIDPQHNVPVAGARFDMTADDVLEFCAKEAE